MPRGVWGRGATPRLTTLSTWLGQAPDQGAEPDAVVLRYLRSFGPATVADIRTWSWLGGLREVIERIRPRLRTYRDEKGREPLHVEHGRFADPDEPAPVRFLPEYALAETVNGLYKAELINRRAGPWRSVEEVELATADWVDFWNTRRLHEACGYLPPAEFEATYHASQEAIAAA